VSVATRQVWAIDIGRDRVTRRVFYSFQYKPDNWRAAKVRNANALTDSDGLVGNKWEEVRRDTDLAITRWINGQIRGTSCTIVLIGTSTASSDWVNYEIRHSWQKTNQGIFGIRIHRILDRYDEPSVAGQNPFKKIRMSDGSSMSDWVDVYDPPGITSAEVVSHIRANIELWVEAAISKR
jgi:hypothetical protein